MPDVPPSAAVPTTPPDSPALPRAALPEAVAPTGQSSVVYLPHQWFAACESKALRRHPKPVTLQGVRLVLFRGADGAPAALLDRCPHRNVPLSRGSVVGGELECAYHGWRFESGGACTRVPGLCRDSGERGAASRRAPAFATRELDGFVWVYSTPDATPTTEPYRLPKLDAPGYTTVRRSVDFPGTLVATVENALDVPHTAFLHRGLFRGAGEPNRIDVRVTRTATSVEAEYIGEPRPEGLVGRMLSPSGGLVQHWDRFILPCVAQVEYRLGDENHFLVTSIMTPVDGHLTRAFAVLSFNLRVPGWLIQPFLAPIAMRIFKQDAEILGLQSEAGAFWGGERYVSTEIDILGAQIQRLLKRAADGRLGPDDKPWVKELVLEA